MVMIVSLGKFTKKKKIIVHSKWVNLIYKNASRKLYLKLNTLNVRS